eukprot:SAG11_NODE_91_length_17102_cov_37.671343_9_plen_178_part_00
MFSLALCDASACSGGGAVYAERWWAGTHLLFYKLIGLGRTEDVARARSDRDELCISIGLEGKPSGLLAVQLNTERKRLHYNERLLRAGKPGHFCANLHLPDVVCTVQGVKDAIIICHGCCHNAWQTQRFLSINLRVRSSQHQKKTPSMVHRTNRASSPPPPPPPPPSSAHTIEDARE